mmetsp:Transcript_118118/g.252429  ORF Transcript_118118/g.252429 Transcript_118118/m.252429 type:complete len:316 (-) Transcript_118118:39-986(-)
MGCAPSSSSSVTAGEEKVLPAPSAMSIPAPAAELPLARAAASSGEGCAMSMCENGCGRCKGKAPDGRLFNSCCKSCAFLHKERGFCGHDIACDIRHNDGSFPPWYWKSSSKWPETFHEEVGGEYVRKMGTKLLKRRMPACEVVRCERIEDSTLWSLYAATRAEIRNCGITVDNIKPETSESIDFSANTTLDHSVNEVWLLHGTSEDAAKAIAKSNFVCSSGGCFGSGAYFADDASKSSQYAKGRTEDGCKIMLLCRVTLGNMKKLAPGQDRNADRFASDPSYNSVLGTTNTREFIIFNMTQIYPEYLMYYKDAAG